MVKNLMLYKLLIWLFFLSLTVFSLTKRISYEIHVRERTFPLDSSPVIFASSAKHIYQL